MGRIYRDDGPFGELTIGQFGSEQVAGTSISYQEGKIFCYHLVNHYKIAECRDGIIYNAEGNIALARLHDGIIYDTNNKEIARYEGNVYGAAAATVAHILKIDASNYTDFNKEKNVSNPINNNPEKTSEQSSEDLNLLQTIIAILVFLPMLVIAFIKAFFKITKNTLTKPIITPILILAFWALVVIHIAINGFAVDILNPFLILHYMISVVSFYVSIKLHKNLKNRILNKYITGGLTLFQNVSWLSMVFGTILILQGDWLSGLLSYLLNVNGSCNDPLEFFFIAIAVILSFIYLLITKNKLKKKASIQTTETT